MKTIIQFLIVALLMFSADVWAQQHAGLLKSVSGDVTIQRGDTLIKAHQGMQLMSSDIIISKAKGYTGIIFIDGTTIAIGPDTQFNINSYQFEPGVGEYAFSMYLKKGSAIYNSGKIGKLSPESVNFSTPRASVGIRGTRFIIDVE
ncbi:FecR domain-containing protein [Desulfobacula sp.]|uniref:FecR family protein n=1 Tax=Desulfobacula sp. TaxID=2593537 RepID=UPI00260FDFDA|nr:FecR domain-containing protein [Desulfobacula sp.]